MELRDKNVLITGGSSGIGAAVARKLAARGNRVLLASHDEERLHRAAAVIRSDGGTVATYVCDFSRSENVDALAAAVLADGPVDVLFNNAGYGLYRSFEEEDIDEIDRLLAVNLGAHVRLTKALLAPMVERRAGAICFMASLAGRIPITPNAAYCAAKFGMFGLAEALRYELRRFGVEVTVVCPGRVDTPFFDHPTFRERQVGLENAKSIPVDVVANRTIRSIEKGKPVTYIPASLGIATWLYEAAPLVTRPLYSLLMKDRIERMYADAR